MNPIAAILQAQPIVILDGALATELERRGANLDDSLWSARLLLDAPELIKQVHLDYFRAGADCATTASYQATVRGLARRGLNRNDALRVIQQSVALATAARDEFWSDPANRIGRVRPFIAASIGPYGAFLADGSEYRGDYHLSDAEFFEFHRERMRALVRAGADILACETIPLLQEARVLSQLLTEFPGSFAWFTFTARDESHISHGETIRECAALLDPHPQVAAIGINCTAPRYIGGLIQNLRAVTTKPIIVYPNSGETYDAVHKRWLDETACETFGADTKHWYELGARILGGCCRTTPAHIHEIFEWSRVLSPQKTPVKA
ncbi:MAG: homocysteine S-methyltransferase [Anaerolineae bacterium]|nr:homocysteine S-methyltransferase [Anaerolineae bacterium]